MESLNEYVIKILKSNYEQIYKYKNIESFLLNELNNNSYYRSKLIETRNSGILIEDDIYKNNIIGNSLMNIRNILKENVKKQIIELSKEGIIYVVGHNNADVDSVFSSYILTNVLKQYNKNIKFGIKDNLNPSSSKMISDYIKEEVSKVSPSDEYKYILVDHNHLDTLKKENVIGAIDHHIITGEISNLIEMEYASTGLLIYDLFKDEYNFNDYEKQLIALTVLTDTEYLTSSRFSNEDKKLFEELGFKEDKKELQKKYFKITDFTKNIKDILSEDYKEYLYEDVLIKRTFISSYGKEKESYYDNFVKYIDNIDDDNNYLLVWCDYENLKTYIHFQNIDLEYPNFTSSTNMIINYLGKNKLINNDKPKKKSL